MTLGPLMVDIAGTALTAEDREVLRHPLVGGLLLFSRNYESPAQIEALVAEVHALRQPPLLIAVDQEGGRIQRFRAGFSPIPPMHLLGRQYDLDSSRGLRLAQACGWVLAAELRAVGVDLSFAPVVDLDWGLSEVIGDRAFHRDPDVVISLAGAVMHGMREAGMRPVLKHFPGHGAVAADSHRTLPVDRREFTAIQEDIRPYEALLKRGAAVMVAHVVYPQVDALPASFSPRWLREILREALDFQGVVFSDDLSMAGAAGMGPMPERSRRALEAGNDMILICNERHAVIEVLEALADYLDPVSQVRLARLHGTAGMSRQALADDPHWRACSELIARCMDSPRLRLDA